MPSVDASPKCAVIDDIVQITVNGLKPNCPITVDADIVYYKVLHLGFGHFYANNDGIVTLSKDVSYGGTYTGLQPMGLFTSMRPMPSKRACPRLIIKSSVEEPLTFQLCVWKGHMTHDQVHHVHLRSVPLATSKFVANGYFDEYFLCKCKIQRTYLSPLVRRLPVAVDIEGDPVRGVLFLPRDQGPFPGVVDVFGGAGGCVELRAALLAKHGFAALALAYFKYPGLKVQSIYDINMHYFEKAINWFSSHPSVMPYGVSMIGICLGAQLTLLCSVKFPSIRSAICINSNMIMTVDPTLTSPWTSLKDCSQANSMGNLSEIHNGLISSNKTNPARIHRPSFRLNNDIPMLFMVGEHDLYKQVVDDAIDQLRRCGKRNISKIEIKGQGHLIEPPYMPLCMASTSPMGIRSADPYDMLIEDVPYHWHGNYENHGHSQLKAWNILLDFLHASSSKSDRTKAKL